MNTHELVRLCCIQVTTIPRACKFDDLLYIWILELILEKLRMNKNEIDFPFLNSRGISFYFGIVVTAERRSRTAKHL